MGYPSQAEIHDIVIINQLCNKYVSKKMHFIDVYRCMIRMINLNDKFRTIIISTAVIKSNIHCINAGYVVNNILMVITIQSSLQNIIKSLAHFFFPLLNDFQIFVLMIDEKYFYYSSKSENLTR